MPVAANNNKDKKKAPMRSALGRGLDALIPRGGDSGTDALHAAPAEGTAGSIFEVPLSQIEANPFQPRTTFDQEALEELADSIRAQGIIQPITVRRLNEGTYQLISGERRFRASQLVGLARIPAYVRTANDEQMLEMAIIENIQRENLNPIEEALGYKRLMDECSLTLEKVGEKVGKKRPTINNYLRLLKLPPEIQASLRDGRLSMGHARALITIDNPLQQLAIYAQVMQDGLSVRATEELVRAVGSPKAKAPVSDKPEPTAYELQAREMERSLGKKFDTRVKIDTGKDGSGEIRFRFFNGDDLNRLLEILG
ncbi:MAG: ParB/RepB/Spo0J family partition protein [Bacteroidetes bacterium]|nr:ParB/RepB/Spo0J family partition protein [Bacteroidota bacterium]